MQKLRDDGGSGMATIPREFLERDDVLHDGEIPDKQNLTVDRLGERAYLVRLVDDGDVPDLAECESIERIVGQRLLQEDAFGQARSQAD